MIDALSFTNVNGASVTLNDLIAPVKEFTTEVDTRFTERQKSQQHGIYQTDTYWGKRLFHITGDLIGSNAGDYMSKRQAMMNAFLPRPQLGSKKAGTLYMTFSGYSEQMQADCTLDGYPELPMQALAPAITSYQINLKSFDPRIYGAQQQATLYYNLADNLGGHGYNKTYNRTYTPNTGGYSSYVVANAGNVESYPILEFHGPSVTPSITLFRGDGQVLKFTLNVTLPTVNDIVTVDMGQRTVTLGSGANGYAYAVGSSWWALEAAPYVNTIYYTAFSGNSTSYVLVKWRNAYML